MITRRLAGWFDDRLRASSFAREALNKVFPDHWSFMLGEVALYCFVVLVLTGTFLTFFFQPSAKEVVYHGHYAPLRRVRAGLPLPVGAARRAVAGRPAGALRQQLGGPG